MIYTLSCHGSFCWGSASRDKSQNYQQKGRGARARAKKNRTGGEKCGLERGQVNLPGEFLFEGAAIKEALPEVSKVRLEQTLYAEYPALKPYLAKLEGDKTEQYVQTLAEIWKCSEEDARKAAEKLSEVGFFSVQQRKGREAYWVPFLYRSALNLVQGAADEADDE